MTIATPKLTTRKQATLYPYYAGYSYNFVLDILSKQNNSQTVLDPWSGTGLTSLVAKQMGLYGQGIDINPVMTIIAKANNIHCELSPSIKSLTDDLLKRFRCSPLAKIEHDPLKLWFTTNSSQLIRSLEFLIYRVLVAKKPRTNLVVDDEQLSSLASFFYIALFRLVKNMVKLRFSSSNPTWIKIAKNDSQKISITRIYLLESFQKIIDEQIYFMQQMPYFQAQLQAKFSTADSKKLPIENNSIDCILTSPPYCTRIDYAVCMRPELAILGLADAQQFKSMRQQIIGTPTIRSCSSKTNDLWGGACNEFLQQVKSHPSIASNGYYHSNLIQYFDDMYCSFQELSRVCKPNATLGLVVQDSFYKELHNDLPTFFTEMLSSLNFEKTEHISFKTNSLDNINVKSAKYTKPQKTLESFLSFRYTGTLL